MRWKAEQLEHVPCDLCQSHGDALFHVRGDGMKVVQCSQCGLVYLNPRPKPEFIEELYQKEYFENSGGTDGIGYSAYIEQSAQPFTFYAMRQRLRFLGGYVKVKGADCLEIGCATGEMCCVISKCGGKVLGIDVSEEAVAIARQRYPHLDFRVATVEELPESVQYDVIFGFELIEHTLSPTKFMKEVAARLRPGGTVVLSTPNLECGRRVGFDRWLGFLQSFEHLYYFTPDTLSAVAQTAGLTMYDWYTSGGDGTVESTKPVSRYPRLKRVLSRLGLYNSVKTLHLALARPKIVFERQGQQHNLLAILVRSQKG